MPKEDKTPQEVVVDDELEVKPKANESDESIEVDLEDKPKEVKKDEPKYASLEDIEKLRKQLNGVSSTLRHVKDIPSQIEELKQAIASNRDMTLREKSEAKDELDELVEGGHWKEAVNRLAEKKTQEILRFREEAIFRQQSEQESVRRLEENKHTVLEKYPDLADGESELAQLYIKVRNENPWFNRNEAGPLLAMYKMEEELKKDGRLDSFTQKVVDKEVLRQARAGASKVGSPTNGKSNTIILTKEQKEFCDSAGLKYEDYGKSLRQINTNRTVEV